MNVNANLLTTPAFFRNFDGKDVKQFIASFTAYCALASIGTQHTPDYIGYLTMVIHIGENRLLGDAFKKFKREHHPGDAPNPQVDLAPLIGILRERFETNETVKKSELMSRILNFKFARMDLKTLDAFKRLLSDYQHHNGGVPISPDLLCQAFHQAVPSDVAKHFLTLPDIDPDSPDDWQNYVETVCKRNDAYIKRVQGRHSYLPSHSGGVAVSPWNPWPLDPGW